MVVHLVWHWQLQAAFSLLRIASAVAGTSTFTGRFPAGVLKPSVATTLTAADSGAGHAAAPRPLRAAARLAASAPGVPLEAAWGLARRKQAPVAVSSICPMVGMSEPKLKLPFDL